jgi:hypothetical protein
VTTTCFSASTSTVGHIWLSFAALFVTPSPCIDIYTQRLPACQNKIKIAETARPWRSADRRDFAAADGVPPGVHHPVRRRQRRLRGAPEQRLPDLQPEARRGRGRREAAAPGPEARRLRHLPAAAQPRQQPHQRRYAYVLIKE